MLLLLSNWPLCSETSSCMACPILCCRRRASEIASNPLSCSSRKQPRHIVNMQCMISLFVDSVKANFNCQHFEIKKLPSKIITSAFNWFHNTCNKVHASTKHTSQSLSNMPVARTFRHNLRTMGCIWTFYISNNCSTIKDIPSVV